MSRSIIVLFPFYDSTSNITNLKADEFIISKELNEKFNNNSSTTKIWFNRGMYWYIVTNLLFHRLYIGWVNISLSSIILFYIWNNATWHWRYKWGYMDFGPKEFFFDGKIWTPSPSPSIYWSSTGIGALKLSWSWWLHRTISSWYRNMSIKLY